MGEQECSKRFAKELIKKGEYEKAKSILEELWNTSSKDDMYILYMYGEALRKTNESIKFVEVCRDKEKLTIYLSNKYIKSMLCWCIYDSYIKNYTYNPDDIETFRCFIQRSEFIVANCTQESADKCFINPFVLTIRKVVKVYKDRGTNYRQILKWISNLKPEDLPEDVFTRIDSDGKERERASLKEFYYQNKSGALEKIGEYYDCIECCETAFKVIKRFHYKNHIWLKERLLYSKCMVAEDENESLNCINEYKIFANKANYWYMYHKISQYYYMNNKIEDALVYASKALCTNFNGENMNKLILDIGFIFENKGDIEKAKIFFQACAFYRERNKWIMPEELKYKILEYDINIKEEPKISIMKKICKNIINESEEYKREIGIITKIFFDRGFGFIMSNNQEEIYFKIKNIYGNKTLNKGQKVNYEIIKDSKGRKNAIKIKGVK